MRDLWNRSAQLPFESHLLGETAPICLIQHPFNNFPSELTQEFPQIPHLPHLFMSQLFAGPLLPYCGKEAYLMAFRINL